MIPPTVGRFVLYHPCGDMPTDGPSRRCAAIITAVHTDNCVNLCVVDANGLTHSRTSVRLRQPESESEAGADGNRYCEWMPYQVGQAAKAEKLQQQLDAAKEDQPAATPE